MKGWYSDVPSDLGTHLTQIARGKISGASLFSSYGERTETAAFTQRVVWPLAATQLPIVDPAGVALSVVSDSAQDGPGGTGALQVEIHYLDANLVTQNVDVTMNGTTPVTSATHGITDCRWIQCLHVALAGTDRAANGTITVTGGGDTLAVIPAGYARCASSVRRVPAGKRAMIYALVGGSGSGTAATQSVVRFATSAIGTHLQADQGMLIPEGSLALQDTTQVIVIPGAFPVPAEQFIGFLAEGDHGAG